MNNLLCRTEDVEVFRRVWGMVSDAQVIEQFQELAQWYDQYGVDSVPYDPTGPFSKYNLRTITHPITNASEIGAMSLLRALDPASTVSLVTDKVQQVSGADIMWVTDGRCCPVSVKLASIPVWDTEEHRQRSFTLHYKVFESIRMSGSPSITIFVDNLTQRSIVSMKRSLLLYRIETTANAGERIRVFFDWLSSLESVTVHDTFTGADLTSVYILGR